MARATDVTHAHRAIRMFGRELVVYRVESGRIVLLDAYSSPMQAHLLLTPPASV